jgi:environmental stress-induced protein Ves
MTWQIVSLADVPPSPWKNGGGVTRELVAWPNAQDWVWRLSVADVASDGPFSRFEGVQRWFAVLSGAGVCLAVGRLPKPSVHTLTPGSPPLVFAGDVPVSCTLIDGPTQDLNLMLRGTPGCMREVKGGFTVVLGTTKMIAIYAHLISTSVLFCAENLFLPPDTLAWRLCPAGSTLQVHSAHAFWMEIDA